MSEEPLISICLPIFNAESFLKAALESILSQSLGDFELLIADDGSTDGSQDLIAQYAAKDKRIKYWRNQKNLGAVRNYNECFGQSRGRYIKPFAADDIMHELLLEKLLAPFEAAPQVALVSCARQIIDAHGTKGDIASSFDESSAHDGPEIREESLRRIMYIHNLIGEPSCVMIRRSQMPKEGFDKNYYHITDLDLWMQVLSLGKLYYVAEPLCYYRKHKDTTTTNNFRSLYYALDFLRFMDKNAELASLVFGSRDQAYATVAEHLGRFVHKLVDGGTVSLETISASLLDSQNPLHLQSGIAQAKQERPETLSDAEYFRLLALFALFKAGEKSRSLDQTFADLNAEIEKQRLELDAVRKSRIWKLRSILRGLGTLSSKA